MVFLTFVSVPSWLSVPTPEHPSTVVSPCSVLPQQLCRVKQVTSGSTALHYNPGTCSYLYQFISLSVCLSTHPQTLKLILCTAGDMVGLCSTHHLYICVLLTAETSTVTVTVDRRTFQPNKSLYHAIQPGITHPFIQLPPTYHPSIL